MLDCEPLEVVDRFSNVGPMFTANQNPKCIGTLYQAVLHSALLEGCDTRLVRAADRKALEVFDNLHWLSWPISSLLYVGILNQYSL